MALTKIDDRGLKTPIDLLDNEKIRFGTGNDLEIYHDGTHSHLKNSTGNLTYSAATHSFQNAATNETQCWMAENGAVELYYDNVKKLETTAVGANVLGTFTCDSTINLYGELNLAGTPTDKYLDASITDGSTDYWMSFRAVRGDDASEHTIQMRYQNDGAVELNYDGVKKFETDPNGVKFNDDAYVLDNNSMYWGNGNDLRIFHDGSNSYIKDAGTGNLIIQSNFLELKIADGSEYYAKFNDHAGVELYYDNSKKVETYSNGLKLNAQNNVWIQDNGKLVCGGGSDLQIFHDGSHSEINNSTGNLHIRCADGAYIQNAAGTENRLKTYENGSVELYYDNSKKLNTNSTGVGITGNVTPVTTNTYNLGSPSYRWDNLYVNDMHFSNHPENPNSVDGTWGDWTLQEGENDIYMLNNRTGKKYKMALTEVS